MQYRYGTTTTNALKTLYREGGVLRFYRGLGPALIQVLLQHLLCQHGSRTEPHVERPPSIRDQQPLPTCGALHGSLTCGDQALNLI